MIGFLSHFRSFFERASAVQRPGRDVADIRRACASRDLGNGGWATRQLKRSLYPALPPPPRTPPAQPFDNRYRHKHSSGRTARRTPENFQTANSHALCDFLIARTRFGIPWNGTLLVMFVDLPCFESIKKFPISIMNDYVSRNAKKFTSLYNPNKLKTALFAHI